MSCLFRKDPSKTVGLLLSFAAGVMTSVVCFDLLTEALRSGDSVGLVMAAAIALHNVPEDMVIGASFARMVSITLLNRGGLTMAIVIGLHIIPKGMAVAVPLISGGMPKWRSALITAMTGFPAILGALFGCFRKNKRFRGYEFSVTLSPDGLTERNR